MGRRCSKEGEGGVRGRGFPPSSLPYVKKDPRVEPRSS